MKKKLVSMLLMFGLTTSLIACGSSGDITGTNGSTPTTEVTVTETGLVDTGEELTVEENNMPIATDGSVEFSVYTYFMDGAAQVYTDLSEHPVVEEIVDITGVNLTFIHPPAGDQGVFFNTTLASGDLPDLFRNDWNNYPGGVEGAIEDGVIINMNELIAQYAPNYQAKMATMPESVVKNTVSDDGVIIGFGAMTNGDYLEGRTHVGLIIREDLLEKYGLDMPVTIDDYTEFFAACKADGIKTPLAMPTIANWDWGNQSYFASAYGVTQNGFYIDNGTVYFSRIQDEYKEYVTKLNEWYTAGYITSDFISAQLADAQTAFKAGNAGVTSGGNWVVTTINEVGKGIDPNFAAVGSPYPRMAEGDAVKYAKALDSGTATGWFISSSCEDPISAVKFIDSLYLDEIGQLAAWGANTEEEPTWEMVDGKKRFTEFMTNNPDTDYSTMLLRYCNSNFQVQYQDDMQEQQYEPYEEKIRSWENWANNTSSEGRVPDMITPTTSESSELANIMTPVDTYTDEMIMKFIVGSESLDNWDTYVEAVRAMNIDRATELTQAAVERYNAR